jgi:hypothetical protein
MNNYFNIEIDMHTLPPIKFILRSFVIWLFLNNITFAQVGINIAEPEGALHLNSSTSGLVYPRVALTSTNSAVPVINPNAPNLVVGTIVYNTDSTSTGSNDVYPGIYAWNGMEWEPQFPMEDYKIFKQTPPGGTPGLDEEICQRTDIKNNESEFDNLNGLTSRVFRPKYSGRYKIKVSMSYGAGELENFFANDDISVASSEGNFYFECIGPGVSINPLGASYNFNQGWIYAHSYSVFNERQNPDNSYSNAMMYSSVVYHKNLRANEDYIFNLAISILELSSNEFVNNGDSGTGLGHVGHDIPCSVEFIYLGEN